MHSRSRVGEAFPQCKTSHAHVPNAPGIGALTPPNANPNRQLHSIWHGDTRDHPNGHKSNGHALSLALQSWTTATILLLLVTGNNEFHWLLNQASVSSPSEKHVKNFPHQMKNTCTQSTNKGGQWWRHAKIRHKKWCECNATHHGQQNKKMASATVTCLSSCQGVLESQNSLTPTVDGQMGQKIGLTPIRGQG